MDVELREALSTRLRPRARAPAVVDRLEAGHRAVRRRRTGRRGGHGGGGRGRRRRRRRRPGRRRWRALPGGRPTRLRAGWDDGELARVRRRGQPRDPAGGDGARTHRRAVPRERARAPLGRPRPRVRGRGDLAAAGVGRRQRLVVDVGWQPGGAFATLHETGSPSRCAQQTDPEDNGNAGYVDVRRRRVPGDHPRHRDPRPASPRSSWRTSSRSRADRTAAALLQGPGRQEVVRAGPRRRWRDRHADGDRSRSAVPTSRPSSGSRRGAIASGEGLR